MSLSGCPSRACPCAITENDCARSGAADGRGVRLLTFTNDRSFSVSEPRVAGYHKFKMADPLGGENKSHSGRASVEKSFHGYGDGGDGDGVGGQPFWSPFSRGGGYDEDFRGVAPPKMADPINRA